ncbi:hypothetical protein FNV43_RR04933 [Rhamnella rubrinervis]|uniref:DUF1985 domain-containing protein n=1 Tax=Rhamnella rubrinervis TaxID=2594499 RepID=A0A8K0HKG6_9ROSA|nr:hypothetical protein FNV43_RR04933 [Rhamnella rubrinervis]
MDKLLASWIGKFLKSRLLFCGGFIHHLLLHQVECDDKYVMEFDFNGIGARFDRKCFAMITGLNCGKFPHGSELDHLPYDLWTKFFGKRGPMTQGEFSKAFEDLDFDEKKLQIMSSAVLDIHGYPYDATIASLLSRIKRGHEIANYSVSGFPLAFQIWGFETIPIVATIGPRGKYHGSNWIPRMLAWSCPSILQYTKLATTIFDRKDDASQSAFQHTSRLEMQIEEIRSDHCPTCRHGLGSIYSDRSRERAALSPSLMTHLPRYTGTMMREEFVSTDFDKWIMVRKWMPVSTSEEDDKLSSNVRSAIVTIACSEGDERLTIRYVCITHSQSDQSLGLMLIIEVDIRTFVTLSDPNNSMTQDSFRKNASACRLFPYLLMVHGYYDLYRTKG